MINTGLITAHFRRSSVIPSFFPHKISFPKKQLLCPGSQCFKQIVIYLCLHLLLHGFTALYKAPLKPMRFGGILPLQKLYFGNLTGRLWEGRTSHSSSLTITWCFNQAFLHTNRVTTPGFHFFRTSWNEHLNAHEINNFITWTAHLKSKNMGSIGVIISLQTGLLMGQSQDVYD